jgi:predicted kinase
MIKAAKEKLTTDHATSIVFDATNSSVKKRAEYIKFAKAYTLPIRCVHVNTSMEESLARNNKRQDEKVVPRIAYSVYKKHFEKPSVDEGFYSVEVL